MSIIDIIIVGVIGIGAYFGYKKGFLYQISSLLGFGLAYLFTGKLFLYLHHYLISEGFLSETSSKWISYVLCFVAIVFIVKLTTKFIVSLLKTLGLNLINRFAGALVGGLKWALFISLVVYALYDLGVFQIETIQHNKVVPSMQHIGSELVGWLQL